MATETATTFFRIIYLAILRFYEDNGPRMAAALAYYTIFSIPGMLFIAIAIAGSVFGKQAAENELYGHISGTVGDTAAKAIEGMINSANKPGQSSIATLVGIATLLFGGSGVFLELQSGMNVIWRVPTAKYGTVFGFLWQRFISLMMVFGIGLILLTSLAISAGISAVGQFVEVNFPAVFSLMRIAELSISYLSMLLLFALIYKIIPDRKVLWADVWLGASVASILFTISKFGIGWYLANSSVSSTYGAAGSLIIILIWVYFSAQILLLGAEITHVFAKEKGSLRRAVIPARKLDVTGTVSSEREATVGNVEQELADAEKDAQSVTDPDLDPAQDEDTARTKAKAEEPTPAGKGKDGAPPA